MLPSSCPAALTVWERSYTENYTEEPHVCPPCLLLSLKMEEGREGCKLDSLMGKKVASENAFHQKHLSGFLKSIGGWTR